MGRLRHGKIARLPVPVRTEVNRKMRDNVPVFKIVEWLFKEHGPLLKELKIEAIGYTNMNGWRKGGYKEWERQQERLEEMRVQRELAFEIASQSDGSVQAANLAIAAGHIYEALQDFDVRELKKKLKENPALYSLLIDGVSKLSRAGVGEKKLQLEFTKYQDKVAEQKSKLERELGKAKKGGLTPKAIAAMEEALNLL